jgi:hypothetical protein
MSNGTACTVHCHTRQHSNTVKAECQCQPMVPEASTTTTHSSEPLNLNKKAIYSKHSTLDHAPPRTP